MKLFAGLTLVASLAAYFYLAPSGPPAVWPDRYGVPPAQARAGDTLGLNIPITAHRQCRTERAQALLEQADRPPLLSPVTGLELMPMSRQVVRLETRLPAVMQPGEAEMTLKIDWRCRSQRLTQHSPPYPFEVVE